MTKIILLTEKKRETALNIQLTFDKQNIISQIRYVPNVCFSFQCDNLLTKQTNIHDLQCQPNERRLVSFHCQAKLLAKSSETWNWKTS